MMEKGDLRVRNVRNWWCFEESNGEWILLEEAPDHEHNHGGLVWSQI